MSVAILATTTGETPAMPATLWPLFQRAETHPATAVPWLSQALAGEPSPTPPTTPVVKSRPASQLRSGWLDCVPTSMTSHETLLRPVVMSQASGASMSWSQARRKP